MKTTLLGVLFIVIGILSLVGGATGAPLLIAMFGGMRGRATDTTLTRVGMGVGGVLVVALGVLLVSGYVGASGTATP